MLFSLLHSKQSNMEYTIEKSDEKNWKFKHVRLFKNLKTRQIWSKSSDFCCFANIRLIGKINLIVYFSLYKENKLWKIIGPIIGVGVMYGSLSALDNKHGMKNMDMVPKSLIFYKLKNINNLFYISYYWILVVIGKMKMKSYFTLISETFAEETMTKPQNFHVFTGRNFRGWQYF